MTDKSPQSSRPRTGRSGAILAAAATLALASGCSKKDVPAYPESISGSCSYTNKFSSKPECRDYHGEWPAEKILEDCADWNGTAVVGKACDVGSILGKCIIEKDGRYIAANIPGNNPDDCGSSIRGCEFFGGGAFEQAPACGGVDIDHSGGGSGLPTVLLPVKNCVDPKAGEPAGKGPGGKVCTWEMISGATEEGRDFRDYASCDRVRTQRPYYYAVPEPNSTRADDRLMDPTYLKEVTWVKSQITATACTCCHSSTAPKGPSNWFIESQGNFINTFYARGLAMGAGWIDTAGLGAYPPEENNGFSRATPENPYHTVFVTTDDARMRRFFEAELAYRGKTKADFVDSPNVGGPIDEQRFFRPTACVRGEGVAADGTINWKGGNARYLWILEAQANSPTVPPNLDLPKGTIWRIDVPAEGKPIDHGTVKYGQVPAGLTQAFPTGGAAPAPLTSGTQYYLYVSADILQPVTRCLFTAP